MQPDARLDHLRKLAGSDSGKFDAATLPAEVYDAWKRDGVKFGKFVVLGELGRGGTSVVWLAWQTDLRREVALKAVSGINPEMRERFFREARATARIAHPGVLPVYESGEEGGTLWLSMPRVKGATMDGIAASPAEAASWIAAAAHAVHAAHECGVVHRDLKPRNLMKDASGAVLVMDFGLALMRDEATRISVTGQVLGTPQYMAPEQAAGGANDARTDVYGLGATLYRLLAGRPPYEAGTLTEFLAAIAAGDPDSLPAATPRELATVVLKAMDRDPARRYASAAALADDLERFASGAPVLARRTSVPLRVARALKRRPAALAAVAMVVALWSVFGLVRRYLPRTIFLPGESSPVESRPVVVDLEWERAQSLEISGQLEKAIEAYSAIVAAKPDNAAAWMGSASCRMVLRQWLPAADDLRRYAELKPEDPVGWRKRAQCLLNAGHLDDALATIGRAIALEPAGVDHLYVRSLVHLERRRPDLALEDVDAAVRSQPESAWVRGNRAAILARIGRFDEAVLECGAALELGGRRPEWLHLRGESRLNAGDPEGALEDLREAVALDSSFARACEKGIRMAEEAAAGKRGGQ